MADNKAKVTPASPLHRLRDEMLFIKRFHYVTTLSPDDVRAEIADLAYQPDSLTRVFFPRQRFVDIDASDEVTQFTIKTKVGGLYTELRATGTIYYDSATRKTIVSGQVKFDAVYLVVLLTGLFMLITWGLASFSRAGITLSPFLLLTLGLTNLFYFAQMFRDRDALLKKLAETLTVTDISSARDRLSDRIIESAHSSISPSESGQHTQETTS